MTQASETSAIDGARHSGRLSMLSAAMVVARRDFLAVLMSKAFLFFLLGPLLFVGISVAAAALGARTAESVSPPQLAIALGEAGERAAFAEAHERLSQSVDLPQVADAGDERSIDALLGDKDGNFGGVLTGTLAEPRLTGLPDTIEGWRGEVAFIAAQADGTGDADRPLPEVALTERTESGASERRGNRATATGGITMLFLLTMLLATMVLSNLVEEKANKIIEILAASIPMDAVFLGKLFAMLGISFVGLAVWGAVGLALTAGMSEAAPLPASPAIGWPLFVALFLVYFAMAYLLIGSVFLTVGAMAPTVRDVQTLSMPATILQLLVFFLASYAVSETGSGAELFAILFPLSSPYAMLGRAAQFDTLWWHAAAIAWQVLWVVLFVKFGATLFRRKAMQSGPARGKGLLARLKGA